LILSSNNYDSKKLKDKVANNNIGILLTARNKRNIKNKIKLDALKLNDNEKKLLKNVLHQPKRKMRQKVRYLKVDIF